MLESDPMKMSYLADRISEDSIRSYLEVLASDEFEGRETGMEGNFKAAAFLAKKLKQFGYETPINTRDYSQFFPLYKQSWKKVDIKIEGNEYHAQRDFYALPSGNPNLPSFNAGELVYLGFGIQNDNTDDFSEADLANKAVIIHEGSPPELKLSGGGQNGLSNTKLNAATEAGVRLILVISEHFSSRLARLRPFLLSPSLTTNIPESSRTNVVYISPGMASSIMAGYEDKILNYREEKYQNRKNKTSPVVIEKPVVANLHKITEYEYVPNVVGFLEGNDRDLKHEVLVISAHFDHLGIRGKDIFNGADDDGSGTSSVLEIARVLADISKSGEEGLKRSVLIFFANGEEKGLLGSAYYSDNPLYPVSSTITNLNVDMIGRRDEFHEDNPYYVYIIGSDKLSTDLHEINESVNSSLTNLELDYKYNDPADPNRFYYRSDHYNFAKKNIPVIFYFTGVHEDYHRPTDTIEKIEFAKMTKIVELIFGTAWELLSRDERPLVDKNGEQ